MNTQHLPFTPLRLIDVIQYYARVKGTQEACIFQPRELNTAESLTYADLNQKLTQRAQLLLSLGYQGQPIALLYPTGLDFVVNFLACLAAGAIAVPLSLSRNSKQLERILHILEDAHIQAILTTRETQANLKKQLENSSYSSRKSSFIWLDEYEHVSGTMPLPDVDPESLAFIQYTSGSTSLPKGVMVSHHNIIHNQNVIHVASDTPEGLRAGGWLPQFHDMGLIGQTLHPLYLGGTSITMPPLTFIQRPRRWLELISHYRIQGSTAPNFGYEHCVRFIGDHEDLSNLDLSCWKIAMNGSEPLNADVMTTFSEKFGKYGFDPSAFFPCYGMAETTLFVSGGPKNSGMEILTLNQEYFEEGKVQPAEQGIKIVNCGLISPELTVKIVNPETHLHCSSEEIGEIWIAGSSVTQGYWNNSQKTAKVFHAELAVSDGQHYLRTGDMGFVKDQMLYVTGRIKEMLIIRGRNLYPYDIERTCNAYKHAAGRSGCAVFSYCQDNEVKLACIVEIKKQALNRYNHEDMKQDLRAAIMEQHDINISTLLLVKPGIIPKTSSGKIKRVACKDLIKTDETIQNQKVTSIA